MTIGSSAFTDCISLTKIEWTENIISIGNSAFAGCSALTEETLPDRITSIGNYAFSGCSSLRSLALPEELKELGYSFLEGTKVSYLKIPKKLTYSCTRLSWDGPCEGALELKKVEFEEGMTAIPGNTCSSRDHASYIEEIILPESIKTIGENAFRNCKKLTSVSLPKNISSLGSSAFNGCSALNTVTFHFNNTVTNTSTGE